MRLDASRSFAPFSVCRQPTQRAMPDDGTRTPNFHTSSSTSWLVPSLTSSVKMVRSASAPGTSVPLMPSSPNILAGVAVTALRAEGTPALDHWRKLLTHSRSVIELLDRQSLIRNGATRPSRDAPRRRSKAMFRFVSATHLPAIVSEFSSLSVEPVFTMLHVFSPLVHGYAPSGRPARCMASVTRMNPSG